eukprot:4263693-Pleurochrysis_carterae.AAC.6
MQPPKLWCEVRRPLPSRPTLLCRPSLMWTTLCSGDGGWVRRCHSLPSLLAAPSCTVSRECGAST